MNNSFDSIDRLMEFGMSMAVANQMINTMNHAMSNMNFAGQSTTLAPNPPVPKYYMAIEGKQVGPISEMEIQTLVEKNILQEDTLVWYAGLSGWMFAKDIPQIAKLILLNDK